MGLKLANLRLHLLLTRQKKPFPSNTLKGRLTSIISEKRCWGLGPVDTFLTEKGFTLMLYINIEHLKKSL
jgi:hypothetical protein